jgi:hypothetical protein
MPDNMPRTRSRQFNKTWIGSANVTKVAAYLPTFVVPKGNS